MTMAQGDYLPGTYSRVGTEENPGTYLGGDSGGTSQTMPPKVKKVWVLEHDRWNMRNYWISGGKFSIPAVWVGFGCTESGLERHLPGLRTGC